MELRVHLDVHEENGSFWAEVRELPGCFASGKDLDELAEAVQEAIGMYLEELPPDELERLSVEPDDLSNVVRPQFGKRDKGRPVKAAVEQMGMLIEA